MFDDCSALILSLFLSFSLSGYMMLNSNKKFHYLIKIIETNHRYINRIQVSQSYIEDVVLNTGIDSDKVYKIPISIDIKKFPFIEGKDKINLRRELNIPETSFLIGSFQKDGNGWGRGDEPKLIKGPDIFCKVIIELSKKFNIHVLLTGPSRGYVKKHLDDNNISYTHKFLKNYNELPEFYSMIDLYLMTAREEGGPKSIIECMSMKIPFVATKVGIVEEISNFSKNDIFCEIEDTKSIIFKSINILKNLNNFNLNINYDIIQNHDFDFIAKKYMNIYSKLNNQTSN